MTNEEREALVRALLRWVPSRPIRELIITDVHQSDNRKGLMEVWQRVDPKATRIVLMTGTKASQDRRIVRIGDRVKLESHEYLIVGIHPYETPIGGRLGAVHLKADFGPKHANPPTLEVNPLRLGMTWEEIDA